VITISDELSSELGKHELWELKDVVGGVTITTTIAVLVICSSSIVNRVAVPGKSLSTRNVIAATKKPSRGSGCDQC
jgi:hypothetical protein